MGAYFTRKTASSRVESDPVITIETSTPLTQGMAGMAASKSREATNEPWIFTDEIRKYSKEGQEFLRNSVKMLDHQRKLESELEMCHERLRKFTGDHARQRESNVENINSSNSPSALERNYEQFYDHERMDAIDAIEKSRSQTKCDKWHELNDMYVACLIFEESYAVAQALRKSFLQGISCILTSAPAIGAQYSEARKKMGSELQFTITPSDCHQLNTLSPSHENSLRVIMKETAEFCDIHALVQGTVDGLRKHQEKGLLGTFGYSPDFFRKQKLMKYIEKCGKYAWKLVCQTPPYRLEGNNSLKSDAVFTPTVHQPRKEFSPPEGAPDRIYRIVWPGLFCGSSGRVIRKTEVILDF